MRDSIFVTILHFNVLIYHVVVVESVSCVVYYRTALHLIIELKITKACALYHIRRMFSNVLFV